MAEPFFSRTQTTALTLAAAVFIAGLVLVGLHENYASGAWAFLPHSPEDGVLAYLLLSSTNDLGTSLIVASLLGLFYVAPWSWRWSGAPNYDDRVSAIMLCHGRA